MTQSVWEILGIAPTDDPAAIRRAYAVRLRAVHPEDDAAGFMALRTAYEDAVVMVRSGQLAPFQPPPDRPERQTVERDDSTPSRLETSEAARSRPAFPDTLTIDQTLDELRLDEAREPELQSLRRELFIALDQQDAARRGPAALQRIFASRAMDSSRLYFETETWLAMLLAGNSAETECLIEPAIAYFAWSDPGDEAVNRYSVQVLLRRDALAFRDVLSDRRHDLHKAFLALRAPPWGLDRARYDVTFGLRPRVARLLRECDQNPELERLMNKEAVIWWRNRISGASHGPARFWILLLLPPLCGAYAAMNTYEDQRGLLFFIVWIISLLLLLMLNAVIVAVGVMLRESTRTTAWDVASMGENAP